MAIQNYIGWPVNVNQIVLDSTTISIGEGALRTDELENGHKQSIQKSPYVPEKYQIKMSFDWVNEVGTTGKTEYQLFTDWYKYRHKCGSVPFEFPEILYSSNTGIPTLDQHQNVQYTEYYKITSATEGAKSGNVSVAPVINCIVNNNSGAHVTQQQQQNPDGSIDIITIIEE